MINPGSGAPADETRLIDARIVTLAVRSGSGAPSRVLLPALDR